jgi:hypothetical protein
MNKECKHEWHFVREFYLDDIGNYIFNRTLPAGNYCKFICHRCGKVKYIKEVTE